MGSLSPAGIRGTASVTLLPTEDPRRSRSRHPTCNEPLGRALAEVPSPNTQSLRKRGAEQGDPVSSPPSSQPHPHSLRSEGVHGSPCRLPSAQWGSRARAGGAPQGRPRGRPTEENLQPRAHASPFNPETLRGCLVGSVSPADRCALLRDPHAAGWKLVRAAGAPSTAPGRPPVCSQSPRRRRSQVGRTRAARVGLTRRKRGAGDLGVPAGAKTLVGVNGGEVLQPARARALPRLIHSQNRSPKGGGRKERMEEEREEGSARRGCRNRRRGARAAAAPSSPPCARGRGTRCAGPRRSPRPSLHSPCCLLPALRCSAGPRRLHAPPPAPRHRLRLRSAGPAEPP